MVYHVLNRANFRSRLFRSPAHYQAFLAVVEESLTFVPMRILAYCLMPNHWHLVLYPRGDGDLAKFLQRVTMTHTQRYHAKTRTVGYGHVYQGRYKSLLVESDGHFLALVRYVESRVAQTLAIQRVCGSWFRGARGGAIMRGHVRVAAIDSVGPALLPSAREVRDLWTTSRFPTTCVPLRE